MSSQTILSPMRMICHRIGGRFVLRNKWERSFTMYKLAKYINGPNFNDDVPFKQAEEFLTKLFSFKMFFRIEVHIPAKPDPISSNHIYQLHPIVNGYRKGNAWNRYMLLTPGQFNTSDVIHETIHHFENIGKIAQGTDAYLARAIEVLFLLSNNMGFPSGQSLNDIHNYNAGFYKGGCDFFTALISGGRKEEIFEELWQAFLHKYSLTTPLEKYVIARISDGENYDLGMFVAGICKGMLDQGFSFERVANFIQSLAKGDNLPQALKRCGIIIQNESLSLPSSGNS